MKKTLKKIVASTVCTLTALSSVVTLSGNASVVTIENYGDLVQINDYGYYAYNTNEASYKIFKSSQGDYFMQFTKERHFYFTLAPITDISLANEVVNSVLDKFDSDYQVEYYMNDDKKFVFDVTDSDMTSNTVKDARDICAELKEKDLIVDFYYGGDVGNASLMTPYMTDYWIKENDVENLLDYLAENYPELEYELTGETETITISPDEYQTFVLLEMTSFEEMTDEEVYKIAAEIIKDTGCGFSTICSDDVSLDISYTDIDLYNANYGDVNNDDKVTATDAALVLSYYAKTQVSTNTLSANSDEADTFELLGDINNDGKVTATDAALILKQYAESQVG